jgi:hypothetical protein
MRRALAISTVLLAASCFAFAQDITGDWQGTISPMGDMELRIVLHVSKNPDGTLKATLDSVDLGQNGLAITDFEYAGTHLTFDVETLDASFRGRVMGDGQTILGKWQQGRPMELELDKSAKPINVVRKPGAPSDIDGTWMGTLDLRDRKLRVVFHIVNMEDGLSATFGSPDQGPQEFPATSISRDGTSLKIEAKQFGGIYAGTIAGDHSAIDGTWSQGDTKLPLVLKPVKDPAQIAPKAPATAPTS